uniref:Uncharacterized protein n=1 Tax=Amphimedon queenslandica TaxID=400682 RepID=A0A1X7UV98_AMPQE
MTNKERSGPGVRAMLLLTPVLHSYYVFISVTTVVMDKVSLGQARIEYNSPMIVKDVPSPKDIKKKIL